MDSYNAIMDILNSVWQQMLSSLSWHLNWKIHPLQDLIIVIGKLMTVCEAQTKTTPGRGTELCYVSSGKIRRWNRSSIESEKTNKKIKQFSGKKYMKDRSKPSFPLQDLAPFFSHKSTKRYSERFQEIIWLDISFSLHPALAYIFYSNELHKSSHNILQKMTEKANGEKAVTLICPALKSLYGVEAAPYGNHTSPTTRTSTLV